MPPKDAKLMDPAEGTLLAQPPLHKGWNFSRQRNSFFNTSLDDERRILYTCVFFALNMFLPLSTRRSSCCWFSFNSWTAFVHVKRKILKFLTERFASRHTTPAKTSYCIFLDMFVKMHYFVKSRTTCTSSHQHPLSVVSSIYRHLLKLRDVKTDEQRSCPFALRQCAGVVQPCPPLA